MNRSTSLTGIGELSRLILRRDRVSLLIWVLGFALLVVGVAASIATTYPTEHARQMVASETAGNPTELILLGPVFDSSPGGILAWRVRGWAALGIGLAGMLTIIRHTRVEEESGRRELLGSTVIGRHAPLAAALVVTLGASLVLAALTTGGLIALGFSASSSLALGLSIAADGWIFAAIAAVFAQATQGAGTARGWVGGILALCYLLRAVSDAGGPAWVSWISPIGWVESMQPFAQNAWWPLALVLGFVLVLIVVAYALAARRDLGAGFLPERPGPATAAAGLRTPLALAWRLHRGTLFAWAIGALGFGAALGGVGQSASNQINSSAQLHALLARMGGTGKPVDAFFSLLIYILSQAVAGYVIAATLRLRSEEVATRADPVLTLPVSRLRWASSHLIIVILGSTLVMAAVGLGMGLVSSLGSGDMGSSLGRLLVASLVRLPSIWVLAGIAMALYGLLPRLAAGGAWAVLAILLLLELLVDLQVLNPSVLNISPFAVTPNVLVGQGTVAPLIWLVVIAAALGGIGLLGFQRRDVG